MKLAGAAYLIFLGVRALLERQRELSVPAHFKQRGASAAFRQGILTNILNPKVALFFLAFLPQFIDSAAPSKTAAFLILGLTFVTTGTVLVLDPGVVLQRVQRPAPRKPHRYRAAESRRRLALYFSWAAISGGGEKIVVSCAPWGDAK